MRARSLMVSLTPRRRLVSPRFGSGDWPVALDDAAEVDAGGEGAEGLAPVAAEAGGAEGVGDGFVAVAGKEGALEGEGHLLDQAAGAGLDRLQVAGEFGAQLGGGGCAGGVGGGAGGGPRGESLRRGR